MKVIGMIPVRLESSRLPEKALCDILGLPMVIHTLKRTQMAKTLDEVYVVTDSVVIKALVESHQGKVIMTSKAHQTGSDRLAEAAEHIEADIVVNIQGDEALVDPDHIDAGVKGLINSKAEISILLTQFSKKQSYDDIKAVVNLKNVSHNVRDMWWEGDNLLGKVEVLTTPAGNILKELFKIFSFVCGVKYSSNTCSNNFDDKGGIELETL